MSTTEREFSFNEAVGHWLKEARLKAGLTVQDAAVHINTTRRQIKDIEAGLVSIVGGDFYSLIAAYEIPGDTVNTFLAEYGLQATV